MSAVAAEPQRRLTAPVAAAMRAAIRLAGGREVCFVCTLNAEAALQTARVVARGDVESVLALPGFARAGEMLVHNHPSGVLEPSGADLEVAARLHDDGVGFGIIDNGVTSLYVVVEVPAPAECVQLDLAAVGDDLGPNGLIAARHARYEDRPSQRAMATQIARLYNDGGVGLLEAGTGVGKSLGYLVPALRWAAANGERTIVSTNTINLQEQLVAKDLPFLADALTDQPVRFALLKGWRNYLCLQRLQQARASGNALFDAALEQDLTMIAGWAESTSNGSLSDLATPPRAEVWDEVAAEPDLCQRANCPFYDRCFLFKARREAAQADVIVVNHHLLLSDVAVRRATGNWGEAAVLPAYSRLIIDEGHHLEDAAASHLGSSVSQRGLFRLFSRLERRGKGLLPALSARLEAGVDFLSEASLDLVRDRLTPALRGAREKSGTLFELLGLLLENANMPVLRLTDDFAAHQIWRDGLRLALDDTVGEIELLERTLGLIRARLERPAESGDRVDDSLMALMNEMRGVARRLQSAADALREALDPPPGSATVRWVESRGRDRAPSVATVPLDLAPILRDDLFDRVETAVVTSATLSASGRFDFLASRLGLEGSLEPVTASYPSPFIYETQALLAVPTNLPAPNVDGSGHLDALLGICAEIAAGTDGGMFVLFTSHRDVRAAAAALRDRGADRRWPVLVHGEDDRGALLGRFRDSGRAILLGTASFWEGVDVPGDALRALVIAKLPFRVPTEPVTAAHCEAIVARGGDAFMEYMLPHAALRLKQGFGRLIRTATDRGIVVIGDPRVITKQYGRGLLDGLPPARRLVAPWPDIARDMRAFFASAQRTTTSLS